MIIKRNKIKKGLEIEYIDKSLRHYDVINLHEYRFWAKIPISFSEAAKHFQKDRIDRFYHYYE